MPSLNFDGYQPILKTHAYAHYKSNPTGDIWDLPSGHALAKPTYWLKSGVLLLLWCKFLIKIC